jgi:HPt (histidine-containing phosphotransfer) domain-containing protein
MTSSAAVADGERIHPEFADLWPESRGRIDAALASVERAVAAAEQHELADDTRSEARAAAHKLVGTLGTYGLSATAVTAREIELAFADGGAVADPAELRARLDAVIRAVDSA